MKIFGRDPAVIVGLIEGVIAFLVSLNVVDSPHAALIAAVVMAAGGLLQSWTTTETRLGWVGGLVKALLALAVGYGLHLTDGQQGAVLALLPLVWAAFFRTQASPLTKGSFGLAA